jgi:hypothetical protein
MNHEDERNFEELDAPDDELDIITKYPDSKKVDVYIQSTIGPGKTEKMQVATEAAVMELKYTISQIFGLDETAFHIVYAGRTLDPEDILANYNLESGDTLLLIPVSTAGS